MVLVALLPVGNSCGSQHLDVALLYRKNEYLPKGMVILSSKANIIRIRYYHSFQFSPLPSVSLGDVELQMNSLIGSRL